MNSENEFKAFFGGETTGFPEVTPSPAAGGEGFEIPSVLWKTLLADPEFKRELDRWAEERLGAEIEAKARAAEEELRARLVEEARQEGLALGREAAREELDRLRQLVDGACSSLRASVQEGLSQMEPQWGVALMHVVRRLLVVNPGEMAEAVRRWVRDNLEQAADAVFVKIFLSPADFAKVNPLLSESDGRWQWVVDPNLRDGEVRCETNAGGLLFVPEKAELRLTEIVSKHLPPEVA